MRQHSKHTWLKPANKAVADQVKLCARERGPKSHVAWTSGSHHHACIPAAGIAAPAAPQWLSCAAEACPELHHAPE